MLTLLLIALILCSIMATIMFIGKIVLFLIFDVMLAAIIVWCIFKLL